MALIGHLYGSEVHTSEHCVTISIAFTRKQTRKFKNHRWVKKYLKKYSCEVLTPSMVQYHDKMIFHPRVWDKLKVKLEKQQREAQHTPTSLSDIYQRTFGVNRF